MKLTKQKKLFGVFVACVFIVAAVVGSIVFTRATSSITKKLTLSEASSSQVGVISEYNSGYRHEKVLYGIINGQTAYCLNYGKTANNGQELSSHSSSSTPLSAEKKKLLGYCLAYGNHAANANAQYIGTQAMVWNIVNGVFDTPRGDSAAKKLCRSASNSSGAYSYYTNLKASIKSSYQNKKPSFAAETKTAAKTYPLEWSNKNKRYEVTIPDNNASISNYTVSLSDYKVKKNKKSITVYTKSASGTKTGSITSDYKTLVSMNMTYWRCGNSQHQEFVSGTSQLTSPRYYFKVKTQAAGKLKLKKTDATTGKVLANAKYGLYTNKKCTNKIAVLTTNSKGQAEKDNLSFGTYYVKELKAPEGYTLSKTVTAKVINANNISPTVTVQDTPDTPQKPVFSTLTIEKSGEILTGWKNGKFVYDTATLAGAEYQIIVLEDILDEKGEVVYAKNSVITTVTTDENGKASATDLYCSKYLVKEVTAPEGFVVDNTGKEVTLTKEGETVKFTDKRQKVSLQVHKLDSVDKTPVQGAEFALYADEDIKNARGEVILTKDSLIEKAVSDEKGIVSFKSDVPFASYVARETNVPKGYIYSKEAVSFDADYQGQEKETIILEKEVYNTPTSVEVTKKDITTGHELSGAHLQLLDKNGNVLDKWESVAGNPHKVTKLTIGETYTLEEKIAPNGYLIANSITFEMKDTEDIQKVEIKDEMPTGTIHIVKKGETLSEAVANKNDYKYKYNVVSLSGVSFDITAAEDIVSPDGAGTVYYKKGATVGTVTTDKNGNATLTELPLGKYVVKEKDAPNGYVVDDEEHAVELKYKDQNTAVVSKSVSITNKLQRVAIKLIKQDAETTQPISGAAFVLKTKEDIVDNNKKVILQAGSIVGRAVSDDDGKVEFSELPNGIYLLEEETAPSGYARQQGTYEIDASYNKDKGELLTIEQIVKNTQIKIDISKKDITGENELPGAKLTVLNENGDTIDQWVSEDTPHRISKLPVGKYTLREETAPNGYIIANDVEFEIKDTDEIQQCVMKDDTVKGRIIIYKTDDTGLTYLEGAEFEIKDDRGKTIEAITSNKDGVAKSSTLPAYRFENGIYKEDIVYTVVETKAPKGYSKDSTEYQVSFPYKDDKTPIIERSQTIINKVEQEIPGAPPQYSETPDDTPSWIPPKTGDRIKLGLWIFLFMASFVGIVVFFIKLQKKEPAKAKVSSSIGKKQAKKSENLSIDDTKHMFKS